MILYNTALAFACVWADLVHMTKQQFDTSLNNLELHRRLQGYEKAELV